MLKISIQKYLRNTTSYKARASRQTCSFDVPFKINDKREIIIHSNVSEEKIPPWVIEKTSYHFTRKDWYGNFVSLQIFTASMGYQEVRMINQIVFVQKLKGFYMKTYLREKQKCWVVFTGLRSWHLAKHSFDLLFKIISHFETLKKLGNFHK